MRIPSKEDCYKLMYETGMLPNIVAHSLQVCRVAVFLSDHLEKQGIKLNRELIETSALLHDITKTRSLKTGEIHSLTGAELIGGMGYPEVAYIIGHHVVVDENFITGQPTEVEIVNFADKRVLHDRIVSLQARMDYILAKYVKNPGDKERIMQNWFRAKALEKKLFDLLPFSPDDLDSLLCTDHLAAAIEEYQRYCNRFFNNTSSHVSISFDETPPTGVTSSK